MTDALTTHAHFDVLVLGCGGIGSATLHSLARRGLKVAGIDRYTPPHKHGSSHGHTRAIRKAYFEHPDYVPLLNTAYDLWHELEATSGRNLLHLTGILEAGPADGILVNGVLQCANEHGLPVDYMSAGEAMKQFPGLALPAGFEAVYERDAGYLLVEECIKAQLELARSAGASLFTGVTVADWRADTNGVTVQSCAGVIKADAIVITAGPWAASLLSDIQGIHLEVREKHLHWYANDNPKYRAANGFPVFAVEMPTVDGTGTNSTRIYYGFPQIDASGVKVAEHSRGRVVEKPGSAAADPFAGDSEAFLRACLPEVSGKRSRHEPCYYTMSHDEHFYVDTHPEYPHVAYCAGLSGHGYKFAPVLGEVLADFATQTVSKHNVEFLRATPNRSV